MTVAKMVVLAGILMSAAAAATVGDKRPDMAILAARQRLQSTEGIRFQPNGNWQTDLGDTRMRWAPKPDSVTIAAPYQRVTLASAMPGHMVCVVVSGRSERCLDVESIEKAGNRP